MGSFWHCKIRGNARLRPLNPLEISFFAVASEDRPTGRQAIRWTTPAKACAPKKKKEEEEALGRESPPHHLPIPFKDFVKRNF